jgi:ComF family protein
MGPYEGRLREMILQMKAWTAEDLAEVVAGLWAKQIGPRVAAWQPDLIVPIPLHWMRRWQRGFNASDLLAAALAAETRVPWTSYLLRRVRRTPLQTEQPSPTARKENVKDAFQAKDASRISGKTIVIVDDVMTTGATVHEAARAMRVHKPKAIYAAVLARAH